jgi:hypothetical protein
MYTFRTRGRTIGSAVDSSIGQNPTGFGHRTKKAHPIPSRHAFHTQMKKNNGQVSRGHRVMDHAAAAMEQMELYCVAHPGSPSAVRRPRLFFRSELWIALLGPTMDEGIVGIGPTIAAALRAFDVQYLAGLRPPVEIVGSAGGRRRFGVAARHARNIPKSSTGISGFAWPG